LKHGFNALFKDFIDTAYDPGIFSTQPDAPLDLRVDYGAVYKSAYDATGNPSVAQARASEAVRKNWKRTNINGKWELQRWGVEGEAKVMRPMLVESSRDAARGLKVNGKSLSEIDDDNIRFEPMKPEGNERRFKVYVGETPVSRVSESGLKVLTVPVDMSTIENELATESKAERIKARIQSIETQRKQTQDLMDAAPYLEPHLKKLHTERIQALDLEQKYNQEQLEAINF
jgi:hypothetical protein